MGAATETLRTLTGTGLQTCASHLPEHSCGHGELFQASRAPFLSPLQVTVLAAPHLPAVHLGYSRGTFPSVSVGLQVPQESWAEGQPDPRTTGWNTVGVSWGCSGLCSWGCFPGVSRVCAGTVALMWLKLIYLIPSVYEQCGVQFFRCCFLTENVLFYS